MLANLRATPGMKIEHTTSGIFQRVNMTHSVRVAWAKSPVDNSLTFGTPLTHRVSTENFLRDVRRLSPLRLSLLRGATRLDGQKNRTDRLDRPPKALMYFNGEPCHAQSTTG
jgi:hypothetical protein